MATKAKPAKAKAKPVTKAKAKPAKRAAPKKAAPKQAAPKQAAPKQAALKKPVVAKKKPPTKKPAVLRSGAVVKILDAKSPLAALKKFLAGLAAKPTTTEEQIALGAAQLMLDPNAHDDHGGPQFAAIVDAIVAKWARFPDRTGFHAQEFLTNAFLAVGDDRKRLAKLAALVPIDANADLRLAMASGFALAGERDSMLRALEAALTLGVTPAKILRDPDFAAYIDDPMVIAVLTRSVAPEIPVDLEPHVDKVRAALDVLVDTLEEIGDAAEKHPAADLEAVLAAERAARISLPNSYRALLTMTDGLSSGSCQLFGLNDIRGTTPLAKKARAFVASEPEVASCIPLAYIGRSTDWLFYDPTGHVRGDSGFLVMFDQGSALSEDLADALETAASMSRDQASVN